MKRKTRRPSGRRVGFDKGLANEQIRLPGVVRLVRFRYLIVDIDFDTNNVISGLKHGRVENLEDRAIRSCQKPVYPNLWVFGL